MVQSPFSIIQPTELPTRIYFKELRFLPAYDKIQPPELQSHLLHKRPYPALKFITGIPLLPMICLGALRDPPIRKTITFCGKLITMNLTVYVQYCGITVSRCNFLSEPRIH